MAKSCLRARKTSSFLKDLGSAMSLAKHKAFSRYSTTRPELPFWGSFKLASSSTGLPGLRVNRGLQIVGFLGWSLLSLAVLIEDVFFCCPISIQTSLAEGWWED